MADFWLLGNFFPLIFKYCDSIKKIQTLLTSVFKISLYLLNFQCRRADKFSQKMFVKIPKKNIESFICFNVELKL